MPLVDVHDGPTVRHDVALEPPLGSENLLEEEGASAGRIPPEPVVGAHDRLGLPVDDGSSKRRKVRLPQVPLVHHSVEGVTVWFRTAVDGEVFGGGHRLQVEGMVSLHPTDELHR